MAVVGCCTWNFFFFSICLPTSSGQHKHCFWFVLTGKTANTCLCMVIQSCFKPELIRDALVFGSTSPQQCPTMANCLFSLFGLKNVNLNKLTSHFPKTFKLNTMQTKMNMVYSGPSFILLSSWISIPNIISLTWNDALCLSAWWLLFPLPSNS